MKWRVIAVGRGMPPEIGSLVATYQSRLQHFGGVELEVVAEERRDKKMTPQLAMEREATRLAARTPSHALTVVLDSAGKVVSSAEFAQIVDRWRQDGTGEVCFLIGGPDGLAPAIKSSAALSLSFGAMTYPHMLVRVLLMEQLYRAMTLLHGVPYHR